jgi:hypothetical protein
MTNTKRMTSGAEVLLEMCAGDLPKGQQRAFIQAVLEELRPLAHVNSGQMRGAIDAVTEDMREAHHG